MSMRNLLAELCEGLDAMMLKKSIPGRGGRSHPAAPESETDKASANGLLAPPVEPEEERELLAFEIGEDIHLLLSPINVQVNSPYRIEPALLQPFRTKHKHMLLLSAQKGKAMSATLYDLDSTSLIADTNSSTVMRKIGDPLLVVFPVLPQRHYVLQTTVEEVYLNRLKLRYKDPRYDRRWKIQLAIPATVHLAPTEIVVAIAQRQAYIVRESLLIPDEIDGTRTGHIADLMRERGSPESSLYMQGFDTSLSLTGSLKDISLGGACVALAEPYDPEELLQRLILVSMALPRVTLGTTSLQFMLKPLGIVRNIRSTPPVLTLHIRFLQRLPKELQGLFGRLQHLRACDPAA